MSSVHECIMEIKLDECAVVEQYMAHCKCHMGSTWQIVRIDELPFKCPVSGAEVNRDDTQPL